MEYQPENAAVEVPNHWWWPGSGSRAGGGGNTSMVQGLLLGVVEASGPTEGWWLHNPGKVLHATELHTLEQFILCSVNPRRLTTAPSPRPNVEKHVERSRAARGVGAVAAPALLKGNS